MRNPPWIFFFQNCNNWNLCRFTEKLILILNQQKHNSNYKVIVIKAARIDERALTVHMCQGMLLSGCAT